MIKTKAHTLYKNILITRFSVYKVVTIQSEMNSREIESDKSSGSSERQEGKGT